MKIIGHNTTPTEYMGFSDQVTSWQVASKQHTVVAGDSLTKAAMFAKSIAGFDVDLVLVDAATGNHVHSHNLTADVLDNSYTWQEDVINIDLTPYIGMTIYVMADSNTGFDTRYDNTQTNGDGGYLYSGGAVNNAPDPVTGEWIDGSNIASFYFEVTEAGDAASDTRNVDNTTQDGYQTIQSLSTGLNRTKGIFASTIIATPEDNMQATLPLAVNNVDIDIDAETGDYSLDSTQLSSAGGSIDIPIYYWMPSTNEQSFHLLTVSTGEIPDPDPDPDPVVPEVNFRANIVSRTSKGISYRVYEVISSKISS